MGLVQALKNYRRVCIIRADAGRPDLGLALAAAGVSVDFVTLYDKIANPSWISQLDTVFSQQAATAPLALCFTSSDQIRRLIEGVLYPNRWQALPYWASHARVHAQAKAFGFCNQFLVTA